MPYTNENNYVPDSFYDVITRFMQGVNEEFGTDFVYETFVGTGFYKFFYLIAQNILGAENSFAEAYAKLQDFIRYMNEKIAVPKTPREGLIESFAARNYVLSLRPQTLETAGILAACVQVDPSAEDFPAKKEEILTMLKDYTIAGLYYDGDQRGMVRISNGQEFEFAFFAPVRYEMTLRLSIQVSQNTLLLIPTEQAIKEALLENLTAQYRLGNDFEPEKYFTISRDAPYAASVLLEWKTEDSTFSSDILKANFKDLYLFDENRLEVVIENAATV